MSYQWRDSDGRLCWYEPATWRVFVDGEFVGMACSKMEALSIVRGF